MIRIFFISSLLILLSMADEYPKLFAQLGTPLYQASEVIRRFSSFVKVSDKSTQYHIHARELLSLARSIEENPEASKEAKQRYFKGLRELQKEHDEIMRIVNGYLLKSIDANDYKEFARIINIGLDSLLQNSIIRKRAMAYYVAYRTRGKIPVLDTFYMTLESDPELMDYVKGHMPKVHPVKAVYSTGGTSHKLLLSKDEEFAYTAEGEYCFKSIDIKNFAEASEAASFDFHDESCRLVDISSSASGEYLYLSGLNNGFTVLDVSRPTAPLQKGAYSKLRTISSISSPDDNRIFIVREKKGLSILDISNKEDFRILAHYIRCLQINHLALDDKRSRLYLAHAQGFSVLDITTIGNPREILNFPLEDGSNHVVLSPDKKRAYVASGDNGVHVLDISEDQNISLISTCQTPKYAYHLLLSKDGKKLYVSALDDGVYYINTEDPKDLKHISTYRLENKNASALSSTLNRSEKTLFISFSKAGIAKTKLLD